MWCPTHVQVTVLRAQGLLIKGNGGTNDAFVTIALGKEKFQTSVKEKSSDSVEWHEKCELQIPKVGNKAEIVLTVLHHAFMGIYEFLGCVHLPLAEMDVYERPKNRWYKLMDKPGKEKHKDRGRLEIRVSFTVKAGSLSDLSKKEKHKSSLGQLSHALGGSLISISSLDKRRGLKKLASRIGKIGKSSKKQEEIAENYNPPLSKQRVEDADPGVLSEEDTDDEFALDELSQKGSSSSINLTSTPSIKSTKSSDMGFTPEKSPQETIKEKETVIENVTPASPLKPPRLLYPDSPNESEIRKTIKSAFDEKGFLERIIIAKEITRSPSPTVKPVVLSGDILKKYSGKSREDLIEIILELQERLELKEKHQKDLEEYIDDLLLRVMENSPLILQNPYINCKTRAQLI